MICAQQLYLQGKKRLVAAGCASAAFDAATLFAQVTGLNRTDVLLHPDQPCSGQQTQQFLQQIDRRAQGEPLQYLLGTWSFFGRDFFVGTGVLIPREETELLVQEAIRFCGTRPCRILDLCAGSGAISVTCACELPQAEVTAVELSEQAFSWLQRNNDRYGGRVTLCRGDVLNAACAASFPQVEVLLSNPPYIVSSDLPGLQREVQHEPTMALDGGTDGLRFYRAILQLWLPHIAPGGLLAVECGIGQCPVLSAMFTAAGLEAVHVIPDFNEIGRVVSGTVPITSDSVR